MSREEKTKAAMEWAVRMIEKDMKAEEKQAGGDEQPGSDKPVEHTPVVVTSSFIAEQVYDRETETSNYAVRVFGKDEIGLLPDVGDGIRVYKPLVNKTLKRGLVLLPSKPEEASLEQVYREGVELALSFYDCEETKLNELKVLVGVAMGSWFLDKFRMRLPGIGGFAPVIAIRGPSGSGKDRLMNALRLLSYRPFYDVSTRRIPSLYRPLDQWQGTLCLSEMDFRHSDSTSELVHYLNCRCYGVPISRQNPDNPRVNEVFRNFGETIVTQRLPWEDNALEDRTIPFYCERTQKDIPSEVLDEYVEKGLSLQNKLLYLRLMLYDRVEIDKAARIPGVRDHRLNSAALPLLALSKIAPGLFEDLAETLKEIEKRRREVKALSRDGVVVNAIYEYVKEFGLGEWNRLNYVVKMKLKTRVAGEEKEILVPLQVSDLADPLKMSSSLVRRTLNSLQLHPEAEKLPRFIYLDRSYRPIWVSRERLESRFLEFVPDYEQPSEDDDREYKRDKCDKCDKPEVESPNITLITDITHNLSVVPPGSREDRPGETGPKEVENDLLNGSEDPETGRVKPSEPSAEPRVLYLCKSCLDRLMDRGKVLGAVEKWNMVCQVCGKTAWCYEARVKA